MQVCQWHIELIPASMELDDPIIDSGESFSWPDQDLTVPLEETTNKLKILNFGKAMDQVAFYCC